MAGFSPLAVWAPLAVKNKKADTLNVLKISASFFINYLLIIFLFF